MSEDKDKALVVEFMTKHHLPLRFTDYATAARNRDMASDLLSLLATVRREVREEAFNESLSILNEFGRDLRKADFLARLETAAGISEGAELDRVLVEAMIEDPVGVRLTELALERMDAEDGAALERAADSREGEDDGDPTS